MANLILYIKNKLFASTNNFFISTNNINFYILLFEGNNRFYHLDHLHKNIIKLFDPTNKMCIPNNKLLFPDSMRELVNN